MQAKVLLVEGKFNTSHRRENYFHKAYMGVVFVNGEIRCPVELRLYSTPNRAYACIWVHGDMVSKSGSGYADGYGYHRASAAAGIAIQNAGVELSEGIYGTGDEGIRRAVEAVTRAVYPDAEDVAVIEASA